jgi:hypothetical protein
MVIRDMARLPVSGAAIGTPPRDEVELRRVLAELQVGHIFDESAIHELYWNLGKIVGRWLSEEQRLEVSPVAKAFLSMASSLSEISLILRALEPGLARRLELEVATRLAEYLALDPTVGSREKAEELLSALQQNAAQVAHVCLVARADLPHRTGERKQRVLAWHDDFTALLLDVAKKCAIEPTLRKDRITRARGGWLFEAAQALESFLWPEMRSTSAEARGKRLERSLRRLRSTSRQKSPAA